MNRLENGLSRLFAYLASINVFPTPLVAASHVSWIPAAQIRRILNKADVGYRVDDEKIYLKEVE